MLEHLFGSKTRFKLLRLLFRDPGKPYYVRELTRLLGSQINAVRRELALLEEAGVVCVVDRTANTTQSIGIAKKYYQLDTTSLLYPELQALIIKAHVMGEQAFIRDVKERGGQIQLFLLTGRFTHSSQAPSDILLVGQFKERALANIIHEYEKEFGFEVRYTLMSEQEFRDRREVMDKFLYALFEANHMKVVNNLHV